MLGLGFAGSLAWAPVEADERAGRVECLSSGDVIEAVSEQQVVTPSRAMNVARAAVPNAEILRAALCRETETLVYLVTALRRDGRLVRVTVDAVSGKLKVIH